MTFLLDHLTAVLVGGTLLVALLVVQQRGQQGATEAVLRYQNQTLASHFLDTVQRDVENIRPREEAEAAFDGSYRFSVRRSADDEYTSQLVFPTLVPRPSADPSAPPEYEVGYVVYHATPTGRSVSVDGTPRPTVRVQRYVFRRGDAAPTPDGGSGDLVDFDVALSRRVYDPATRRYATDEETDDATVDETPSQVRVAAVAAAPLPELRAHDQSGATPSAASRHARTVRVANAEAGGGASHGSPSVDTSTSGSIPSPLPGDH